MKGVLEPILGRVIYCQEDIPGVMIDQLVHLGMFYRWLVVISRYKSGVATVQYRGEGLAVLLVGTAEFVKSDQAQNIAKKLWGEQTGLEDSTQAWSRDFINDDTESDVHQMALGLAGYDGQLQVHMPLVLPVPPGAFTCCDGSDGKHSEHCLRQPCPIHKVPLGECDCGKQKPDNPPGPEWEYDESRGRWFPKRALETLSE